MALSAGAWGSRAELAGLRYDRPIKAGAFSCNAELTGLRPSDRLRREARVLHNADGDSWGVNLG